MYSIIKKERGIVNFLAEEDKDILRIRDVCKPGSTVEVLDSQSEEMDEGTEAKLILLLNLHQENGVFIKERLQKVLKFLKMMQKYQCRVQNYQHHLKIHLLKK